MGVPAGKLLVGIGFYGRGWTGVTQDAPGGGATGPAAGKYEAGIEDYKVLKATCPATGTIAGTAFAHCGSNWWSYDTLSTIATKMTWATSQGLRGAFFWEFSGDTSNGELVTAITSGLGSDNPDGDHDGSGTQDICPASGQTAPCLDGPGSGAAGGSPSGGGPGGGTVAAGSAGAGAARPAVTITVRPLSARVARGHRLRLRVSVGGAVNVGARRVAVSLSRRGGGRTLRRTVTVAPDAHGARVVTIGITIPKRAASGKYTSRASLLTGNSRVLARFTGRTIVRITR
jgi:hypothetical protein